jgi:hypothetical protein
MERRMWRIAWVLIGAELATAGYWCLARDDYFQALVLIVSAGLQAPIVGFRQPR